MTLLIHLLFHPFWAPIVMTMPHTAENMPECMHPHLAFTPMLFTVGWQVYRLGPVVTGKAGHHGAAEEVSDSEGGHREGRRGGEGSGSGP